MTSDGGNTALLVALGVGIGFLLGYLLSLITTPAMRRARPGRRRPRARNHKRRDLRRAPASKPGPTAPCMSASGTTGAYALSLDASGLTADGKRMDIPGAVAHCKVSGHVELTLASDGPAQVYIDLDRALAGAGVAVTLRRPDKE